MSLRVPSDRPVFDGFAAYHDRETGPYLATHEGERRMAVGRFYAACAAGGAGALALLLFGPFHSENLEFGMLAAGIGVMAGVFFLNRTRAEITHGLLERVASYFGFTYSGKAGRPALYDQFRRLKLIPGHNREAFEDAVSGVYGGAPFSFCEAHLEMQSSGKKNSRRTVFHGQLFTIDYPKRFLGSTVVQRDLGVLNALTKPSKEYSRVGLASPKFEKVFEAWSTDQVEARDLLDPIVLERFEELERLFGGKKIRAAFDGGKLLIAVETGDRLNIGTMFKPIDGCERVEIILKEFDVIFDLIDVLLKRLEARLAGAFSLADVKMKSANHR
jgi:hypothetical protein